MALLGHGATLLSQKYKPKLKQKAISSVKEDMSCDTSMLFRV